MRNYQFRHILMQKYGLSADEAWGQYYEWVNTPHPIATDAHAEVQWWVNYLETREERDRMRMLAFVMLLAASITLTASYALWRVL